MKYEERAAFEQADAFGIGAPNDAYAQYFVGDSFLHPLTDPKECPVFMANVTFEPGCRNNWHIHHADKGGGQILVCTAGEGVYQEWGKEPQILHPGDVVYIKPGVKHYPERQQIPGSVILRWNVREKTAAMSGVSR